MEDVDGSNCYAYGFYRASYDVEVSGSDILTTDYTFVDGIAENSTTILVDSMTNTGYGWSETLSYTYDCKGNIEIISENGEQKAKYYYDNLNQLVREDNAWIGKTITYTYDNGGNIQLVEEYAYTSGALDGLTATNSYAYLYGDSNWKDKLTSYNGNAITYDEIGNPLTYYDGKTFTWQNGRQLTAINGNGLEISYTYDSNGIRTSKTVNDVTTTYLLEGSNIVMQTDGIDTMWFHYDATGSPVSFELNGMPYFYVKNIQNDIVAITDANGNIVVEYAYNSWGKLTSITGLFANIVGIKNPFRYRGYYYDTETELHYVNSRYYDSSIGRFISADTVSVVAATPGSANYDKNLFAYCDNNPVVRIDSDGKLWNFIIGGVVGAVIGGVTAALDGGSFTDIVIGVAVGTATGLVAASGLGAIAQAGICAGIGAAKSITTQACDVFINKEKKLSEFSVLDVGKSALNEGLLSLVGTGAGKFLNKVTGVTDIAQSAYNSYLGKTFTANIRKTLGKSSSSLLRQASKFLARSNLYDNVGKGISSVCGSLISGIVGLVIK